MRLEDKDHCIDFWPVYKGESFNIWNPDTGSYYAWANPDPVLNFLQRRRVGAGRNRSHGGFTSEYLSNKLTLPCFSSRIAFRNITNRTNSRTIIPCLLPPKVFVVHQASYLLWPRGDEKDQAYLLGILASIPLDWYARCFVELNVAFYIFNALPVVRPNRNNSEWQRIVELAGRLACPDERFESWAEAVGVSVGPLSEDEKQDMIYELDALVAHLYGLNEVQLVHIFKTFHKGWDYHERLDGVLRHFGAWSKR